jgi:hypothetical protein
MSDETKSGADVRSSDVVRREPGMNLTLKEAEVLAKRCEYAWLAAGQKENPINWGDASAFYLEGWEQGMKDAIAIIQGYKPKHGAKASNVKLTDAGGLERPN